MRQSFKESLSGKRGVTLIELLIVVSLISFLGLTLYTIFYQGTKLWQRAILMQPDIESDIIFEKMSTDFRNAFSGRAAEFSGKEEKIEFLSFSKIDLTASTGDLSIKRPVKVTYQFDADSRTLARREDDYKSLLSAHLNPGFDRNLIGEKVKECKFEYLHELPEKKTFEWKNFWNSSCPPKAVMVSLRFDDQRSSALVRKIISLPAGSCSVTPQPLT